MDTQLAVVSWQTPLTSPAVATRRPDLPDDAPDWWTGENTDAFLREQGIVLTGVEHD